VTDRELGDEAAEEGAAAAVTTVTEEAPPIETSEVEEQVEAEASPEPNAEAEAPAEEAEAEAEAPGEEPESEATEAEATEAPEAEAPTEAETADEPDDAEEPEAAAEPEAKAPETPDAEAAAESDEEAEGGEEEEDGAPPASPYDLPGGWYVIHSYSGYENKVMANLQSRIKSMHMEESIFDIVIPMEDVVEIKSGRKVTVPRKQFPGYLLVRMYMDDDSWGVVRNTPGVTGFVGSGTKPAPLSRREVERILGVRKDEEKKAPRFKPDWEVGETVRVIDGPFADFNGVIEDINVDQSKVRVLVDIFGRETPVELSFEQIQKF
jgi:transcriptional antiterminator NusG